MSLMWSGMFGTFLWIVDVFGLYIQFASCFFFKCVAGKGDIGLLIEVPPYIAVGMFSL